MEYQPLDTSRNEIRVLVLQDPSETSSKSGLIECTIEHVSLYEYSDQYRTFLQLDGFDKSFRFQSKIWEFITTYKADVEKYPGDPSKFLDSGTKNFSHNPVYRDGSFTSATVYSWGRLYALSYEWGDPTVTANIMVSGHRMAVTKNLHDALQDLLPRWHRDTEETASARLWVDALCINQQDVQERNTQLQLMEQIYSTATSVLTRLGPRLELGHDDETCELLMEVHSLYTVSAAKGLTALKKPEYKDAWAGVCELAKRSYWRRLWIIQEIFLANTRTEFYFGDQFSNLSALLIAMVLLQSNLAEFESVYPPEMEDVFESALKNIQPFIVILSSNDPPYYDILPYLNAGRQAKQSDIRDKIYGLLGLMDSQIRAHITPDYLQSADLAYRNFAIAFIKSTGKLSVVYQTSFKGGGALQLPSWVPDWTSSDDGGEIFYSEMYYKAAGASASGGSSHKFAEVENPDHLLCRGFKVDSIASLACSEVFNHDDHDTVDTRTRGADKPVYNGRNGVKEAMWDVFSYGISKKAQPEALAYLLDMPYFDGRGKAKLIFDRLDQFQQCNQDLVVDGERLSTYFSQWSDRFENILDDPAVFQILSLCMLPLLARRFIVTRTGFVGMAPLLAKTGDEVFILKGSNVPLLLRPNGDNTYRLVGDCYISGFMDGEAMNGLETGEYQEADIILS
ncbi:heterokaryon incompatibility protein-domain-containing protein [Hypoxylon cercidicola]|nr:heterokaryon incompatibility protein-domain-containing protein [Hypoxylon cercidicola]